MKTRWSFFVVFAAATAASILGPRPVSAADDGPGKSASGDPGADPSGHAATATELTHAMELDKARAELAKGDPDRPSIALAKARLALYEEDCDLAAALLSRSELQQNEDARLIADVARGCARVIASTVVERDEAKGVILRFQDESDRALAPMLAETAEKARQTLVRDLGVTFSHPTRITVVRDLLSLSAMTGLPYKSAQTTGTVAVAKWGRVTILSPRASRHGYALRDTLAHEMTHLAISMQSRERAPLWLHEGLARREEIRWREPGPFDERPSSESIVLRGMEMKLDLPLDKLGPSIAMLPSADAAMVAFAEVTSFIRFLVESSAVDVIPRLLVALRTKPVDEALREVSGEALAGWDVKWRANLAKRPHEPLSALYGLGASPPGMGDSRERARLAELLLGRGHMPEGLVELEKVPPDLLADPSLRYLRARLLEGVGQTKQAEGLVEDPAQWMASFGPCWALRGRFAQARGDKATAASSFAEAVAHDPLSIESACQSLPTTAAGGVSGGPPPDIGPYSIPLCDAARKRAEPDLGRD